MKHLRDPYRRVVRQDSGSSELHYYGGAERWLAVERDGFGGVSKVRFWFGPDEIHYDWQGAVTKRLAHITVGTQLARIEDGTKLEYIYSNSLGHMMASVSDDGTEVTSFIYSPFGEVIASTGDVDNHTRRFNDKVVDDVSGLSYYGYRYYDNLSMTWTRGDPLFRFAPDLAYDKPRMMNVYAFSANNPVRYLDPDGLFEQGPDGQVMSPTNQAQPKMTGCGSDSFCKAVAGAGVVLFAVVAAPEVVAAVKTFVITNPAAATDVAIGVGEGLAGAQTPFGIPGAGVDDLASAGGKGAQAAGDLVGGADELADATERGVDLFRVVDDAELADIKAVDGFRTVAGGYETGKQFVDNQSDAQNLLEAFKEFFGGNQTLVRATAPTSVIKTASRTPFADIPRGTAVTIPTKDLPKIKPILE